MHQCAPKTALRCHKIGASGAFCEQRYWWQKYEDSFCSLFRRKRASKLGIWLETVASGNTFLRYEQDSRDSILTYKGWRSCILRSDRLRPLARSLSMDSKRATIQSLAGCSPWVLSLVFGPTELSHRQPQSQDRRRYTSSWARASCNQQSRSLGL